MRWSLAVWSLNRPGSRTLQWKKPESEGWGLEMEREEEDNSVNLEKARYHDDPHPSVWRLRRHCFGTKRFLTCQTSCRSPDQQLDGSRRCGSQRERVLLFPSTRRHCPGALPPPGMEAPPSFQPLPPPSPLCLLTHKLHRQADTSYYWLDVIHHHLCSTLGHWGVESCTDWLGPKKQRLGLQAGLELESLV